MFALHKLVMYFLPICTHRQTHTCARRELSDLQKLQILRSLNRICIHLDIFQSSTKTKHADILQAYLPTICQDCVSVKHKFRLSTELISMNGENIGA